MAAPAQLLKGFAKVAVTTKPDPKKRLTISDPDTRGLYVRITPKGARTWTIVARDPQGKQIWKEVGDVAAMSLFDARERAREGVARIKEGLLPFVEDEPAPPPPPPEPMFDDELDMFIDRHVRKVNPKGELIKGERPLRSAYEIERIFKTYVRKKWSGRSMSSIHKSDVVALLDEVEANNAPAQADKVLAQLSVFFAWYDKKAPNGYVSPIIRKMRRTKPNDRARERAIGQITGSGEIDDDEFRLFWNTATYAGQFGAFLKICLLTSQRLAKVRGLRHSDIVDGVWTIETEPGEKGNAGVIGLPPMALAIIEAMPKVADNPYVFAGRGRTPFFPGNKLKRNFDDKLAMANGCTAIPHWTIHDLRRTSKTLMQRAGVDEGVSERVLGHGKPGVEGVYGRFRYREKKTEALVALEGLVGLILNPKDNVVQIGGVR